MGTFLIVVSVCVGGLGLFLMILMEVTGAFYSEGEKWMGRRIATEEDARKLNGAYGRGKTWALLAIPLGLLGIVWSVLAYLGLLWILLVVFLVAVVGMPVYGIVKTYRLKETPVSQNIQEPRRTYTPRPDPHAELRREWDEWLKEREAEDRAKGRKTF